MKVVIDIPKEDYEKIIKITNAWRYTGTTIVGSAYHAIAKGTVLPKGHGDLIDRDDVKISYETSLKQTLCNNDKGIDLSKYADIHCAEFNEFIDKVPPVILADKGE